jgi:cell division septal protein FtsQ
MQPNRIVLHGVPPAARSDIEARLRQLWQQQPYSLRVGTGRVQHAMEQFDWVAQAQVHPRFPTHLVISLQSRQPFVEVRCTPPTAGKTFIDPAGIVFSPPNPPLQAPGGVILLSEGVAPPPAGALQQGSPLWRAFALLRILSRHEGAAQYVRTVSIGRGNELTLTCRAEGGTAMRFRLGDAMPYEQQAQLIAQLLQNASPSLAQWEYVDLKSPSYPAVKPMSNSVLRGNTTP